jgi:hypothetical protein
MRFHAIQMAASMQVEDGVKETKAAEELKDEFVWLKLCSAEAKGSVSDKWTQLNDSIIGVDRLRKFSQEIMGSFDRAYISLAKNTGDDFSQQGASTVYSEVYNITPKVIHFKTKVRFATDDILLQLLYGVQRSLTLSNLNANDRAKWLTSLRTDMANEKKTEKPVAWVCSLVGLSSSNANPPNSWQEIYWPKKMEKRVGNTTKKYGLNDIWTGGIAPLTAPVFSRLQASKTLCIFFFAVEPLQDVKWTFINTFVSAQPLYVKDLPSSVWWYETLQNITLFMKGNASTATLYQSS